MTPEAAGATAAGRRYDVLLLDFGGVCLLNPVELHARAESRLGLEPGTFRWMGPVAPETDDLWRRMIAGDLTERDYWHIRAAEVGAAAGREMTLQQYMTLLFTPAAPELTRPEATATVRDARAAGYGVSVLTNDMRAFHGEEWEHGIDFLRLVDRIVDCSDTGVFKPDPRAYERAVDAVDARPQRILFVDDQPLNVEGALDAGMDALWFDIADAPGSWASVAARLGVGDADGPRDAGGSNSLRRD